MKIDLGCDKMKSLFCFTIQFPKVNFSNFEPFTNIENSQIITIIQIEKKQSKTTSEEKCNVNNSIMFNEHNKLLKPYKHDEKVGFV